MSKVRQILDFVLTVAKNRCFPSAKGTNHTYCNRLVSISVKFDICTVVGLIGTHFEAKICTFSIPSAYFSFN